MLCRGHIWYFCSILKEHATISINNGDYEIRPASLGAKSKVNGTPLTGPRVLTHKDRILFGKNFHTRCFVLKRITDYLWLITRNMLFIYLKWSRT